MMSERPEYLFVVNKGSGRDDGSDRLQKIKDFASSAGNSDIYFLPEKFSFKQIKDHVLQVNPRRVVAVGGDGTVSMLACMIAGTDICLGIIPGGSANGMAKELGIETDVDAALTQLRKAHERRIDLIRINKGEKHSIHLSDIGLNARLIKYFDEGDLRGMLGYAAVALKTLYAHKKITVSISTPSETITREAHMVSIANARTYGTGAVINPDGDLGDGKFEIIIARRLPLIAILRTLLRPRRQKSKHIEVISCTSAVIKMARPMHFQVDGEYIGKVEKVEADIVPGVLRVLV